MFLPRISEKILSDADHVNSPHKNNLRKAGTEIEMNF